MKRLDITGQRFGRLIVIELNSIEGHSKWICRCDCGGKYIALGKSLTSGNTKSCGCLRIESADKNRFEKGSQKSKDCNKKSLKVRDKTRKYPKGVNFNNIYSELLTDSYVCNQLRKQNILNPTPEMIEQKRLTIKLKRKINEIQRQINTQ